MNLPGGAFSEFKELVFTYTKDMKVARKVPAGISVFNFVRQKLKTDMKRNNMARSRE